MYLWKVELVDGLPATSGVGSTSFMLEANMTVPCWVPLVGPTLECNATEASLVLLDVQHITAYFAIWITFVIFAIFSVPWTIYFAILYGKLPTAVSIWLVKSWNPMKTTPDGKPVVVGRNTTTVANVVDRLCDGLDVLSVLLISVFAVAVDVEQFRSNSALLLTLVVVVVGSQVPRKFGNGTVIVELSSKSMRLPMNAKALVMGVHPKRFWFIHVASLILHLLLIFFASLPFGCEVLGSSAGLHCKPTESNLDITTVAYVLGIVIVDGVLRVFAIALWIGVVIISEDAAFAIWFATRGNVPNDLQGYMKCVARMRMPANKYYVSRHVYHLEPYSSLIWPEFGLLSSGVEPKVTVDIDEKVKWEGGMEWKDGANRASAPTLQCTSAARLWWC